MNLYDLASRVIDALEAEGIAYMVVGALSSSVLRLLPRLTSSPISSWLQFPRSPSGRFCPRGTKGKEYKWDVRIMNTTFFLFCQYFESIHKMCCNCVFFG